MKFLIIFLLISLQALPATYYVKNGGSDSADGLSHETAWATAAKAVSASVTTGDIVKFNRGDSWREFVSLKAGVSYTCYGTGNLPRFYGSVNKSQDTDWTDLGSNIWSCASTSDIGNIVFNKSLAIGKWCKNEVDLSEQGEFWYDDPNNVVKLYSIGNPATVYTDIEICINGTPIEINSADGVSVSYIDVRYAAKHGIDVRSCTNFYVGYCNVFMIGGGYYSGDDARLGNGIQIWWEGSDGVVEHNAVSQCYDCGISPQGFKEGGVFHNLLIEDNVITNNEFAYEYWNYSVAEANVNEDVIFQGNYMLLEGENCIFHDQRWPIASRATHVWIFDIDGTYSNIIIRNNWMDQSVSQADAFKFWREVEKKKVVIYDNNWIYETYGTSSLSGGSLTGGSIS